MQIGDQLNRGIARFLTRAKKKPLHDIVAVDLDLRGVACVRMRMGGDGPTVTQADMLDPVGLGLEGDGRAEASGPLVLPRHMIARHVAICVPSSDAVVKLLSLPGEVDNEAEEHLKTLMGVENDSYRISYKVLASPQGDSSETKLLTLALPNAVIGAALGMFPVGMPAPVSVEVEGLAAASAFLHGPGSDFSDSVVGVIEYGVHSTFVFFFFKGQLALIRKFDLGLSHLVAAVQSSHGVDNKTAADIISDGSFDISQVVHDVSEPFIKQLVISRHFVERRQDCHVSSVFVPKGMPKSWLDLVSSSLAIEVKSWDPFDGLNLLPGAVSDEHAGISSRFSACVGAALGVLEVTSV